MLTFKCIRCAPQLTGCSDCAEALTDDRRPKKLQRYSNGWFNYTVHI